MDKFTDEELKEITQYKIFEIVAEKVATCVLFVLAKDYNEAENTAKDVSQSFSDYDFEPDGDISFSRMGIYTPENIKKHYYIDPADAAEGLSKILGYNDLTVGEFVELYNDAVEEYNHRYPPKDPNQIEMVLE